MESPIQKILRYTKNNVLRNRWLSLATILVSTIIFTTASIFIASSLLAQRAVKVAETKAELRVYFDVDTEESQISEVKDMVEALDGVENITYISQEEALDIYLGYNTDNPDLQDSVSAEWLPASLEIQATSLEDLESITEVMKEEEATNPFIDEVEYREDVVDQLKSISRAINIGGVSIITIFAGITFALIIITISFNIMAHKNEIEIMHLVGSKDRDISLPFILEGIFYTVTGSVLAATMIIVPWYLLMQYGDGTNAHFILQDVLRELDVKFLLSFNLPFTLIYYGAHILVALLVGFLGGSIAVHKYLNLEEK